MRTGCGRSPYYDKVGTYFAVLAAALASDLIQFSFPERLRVDARSLEQAIFNPRPSGPKEYKMRYVTQVGWCCAMSLGLVAAALGQQTAGGAAAGGAGGAGLNAGGAAGGQTG